MKPKRNYMMGGGMMKNKYEGGGYMEGGSAGREISVMAPTIEEAYKQMMAAVGKSSEKPHHFKIKACYYEGEED